MSGVQLGGRDSDLTIPECGLAIRDLVRRTLGRTVFRTRRALAHDPRPRPIRSYSQLYAAGAVGDGLVGGVGI